MINYNVLVNQILVVALPQRWSLSGRNQFVPVRLLRHGIPRRPLRNQRGRLRERSLRPRIPLRRSRQGLPVPMFLGLRRQKLRTGHQRMRTRLAAVPKRRRMSRALQPDALRTWTGFRC